MRQAVRLRHAPKYFHVIESAVNTIITAAGFVRVWPIPISLIMGFAADVTST